MDGCRGAFRSSAAPWQSPAPARYATFDIPACGHSSAPLRAGGPRFALHPRLKFFSPLRGSSLFHIFTFSHFPLPCKKKRGAVAIRPRAAFFCVPFIGGEEEIRTPDPHVANVMLYQLSYFPNSLKRRILYHIPPFPARGYFFVLRFAPRSWTRMETPPVERRLARRFAKTLDEIRRVAEARRSSDVFEIALAVG